MKRALVLALVVGLLAGMMFGPAEAKKKPYVEVLELAYQGGSVGASTPAASGGTCLVDPTSPFHCVEAIPSSVQAKYIKVEVIDATGQKAGGYLSQGDTDGDGFGNLYGDFCGGHEAPVPMEAKGAPVGISLYAGVCSDGSGPSIVTTGTVKVTFSSLP
ncbi:MAG: hypothetical protein QOG54_287 [Actinomycetota bacterium]|nr:hypothetical protein [Actinomycetota bacterium]